MHMGEMSFLTSGVLSQTRVSRPNIHEEDLFYDSKQKKKWALLWLPTQHRQKWQDCVWSGLFFLWIACFLFLLSFAVFKNLYSKSRTRYCWKIRRPPLYFEPNLSRSQTCSMLSRFLRRSLFLLRCVALTVGNFKDHPFMLNPTTLDVS